MLLGLPYAVGTVETLNVSDRKSPVDAGGVCNPAVVAA